MELVHYGQHAAADISWIFDCQDLKRINRPVAAGGVLGLVLGLSVGFRIANLLLLSGFVAILGVELIRRPCFRTAMAVFAPGWFSITMMDVTMVLNPITSRNLPYDPLKDFAPITLASKNTSLLSVRAQDGPRTVKELVARAKAAPGKLNYGAGIITTRLAGYLFNRARRNTFPSTAARRPCKAS